MRNEKAEKRIEADLVEETVEEKASEEESAGEGERQREMRDMGYHGYNFRLGMRGSKSGSKSKIRQSPPPDRLHLKRRQGRRVR
jgi:SOS response regulatory protein OraA/RecX